MKNPIQIFALAATMLSLAGCATNSVKQTWKSPDCQGPVKRVCVLAVDERGMVRKGFENRFVRDFEKQGQPAVVTHESLSLPEIKDNKEAAAATMSAAGADSVLLVRLVNQTTYNHSMRPTGERYAAVTTGMGSAYGWYNYYSVAFMDMGTVWSTTKQTVYFDASLFDLKSGRRLWSGLTQTVLKEEADRLVEADSLVAKIVAAMHKDGVVR